MTSSVARATMPTMTTVASFWTSPTLLPPFPLQTRRTQSQTSRSRTYTCTSHLRWVRRRLLRRIVEALVDIAGIDRHVAGRFVNTHGHVVQRPRRGSAGAQPDVVVHRPMAWALECIGAIGRADPWHGATEVWALRIERQQSIGTMHEEELALDI